MVEPDVLDRLEHLRVQRVERGQLAAPPARARGELTFSARWSTARQALYTRTHAHARADRHRAPITTTASLQRRMGAMGLAHGQHLRAGLEMSRPYTPPVDAPARRATWTMARRTTRRTPPHPGHDRVAGVPSPRAQQPAREQADAVVASRRRHKCHADLRQIRHVLVTSSCSHFHARI